MLTFSDSFLYNTMIKKDKKQSEKEEKNIKLE